MEAAGAWCFHWHIAHIWRASQAERLGDRIGHSQPQRNTRFQCRAQYNRESHKALEFSKRCLRRKAIARGAFRPWRAQNCTWESYGPFKFQEQKGLISPSAHHIKKVTHKGLKTGTNAVRYFSFVCPRCDRSGQAYGHLQNAPYMWRSLVRTGNPRD